MKIDKEAFGAFFDGTPGKTWDDYASRLKNAAAGEVDERGYSLADEFDGVAEGQPGGPAFPGAAAQLLKAQAAARRRQKEAYSMLTMTMQVKEQIDYLRQNHFQNGRAAFQYMQRVSVGWRARGSEAQKASESAIAGCPPSCVVRSHVARL